MDEDRCPMLNRISRIISVAFFFLFPLVSIPLTSKSVDYEKQNLLLIAVFALMVIYIVKIILTKKASVFSTAVIIPVIFFPFLHFISVLLSSPNKYEAIFNPYGTLTIISLSLLYLFTTSLSQNRQENHSFQSHSLTSLYLSSVLVSVISVLSVLKTVPELITVGNVFDTTLFLSFTLLLLIAEIIIFCLERKMHIRRLIHLKSGQLLHIILLILLSFAITVNLYHLFTDVKPAFYPHQAGWSIMLEVYKAFNNFLFGIGPGNFGFASSLGRPLFINYTPFWNVSVNHSSSYILTLATENGFIILFLWIIIFWKNLKNIFEEKLPLPSRIYSVILALALSAFFLLPVTLPFIILTFIIMTFSFNVTSVHETSLIKSKYLIYLILPVIALSIYVFFLSQKFYLADIYFRRALDLAKSPKTDRSLQNLSFSTSLNPYSEKSYILASSLNLFDLKNLLEDKSATSPAIMRQKETLANQAIVSAQKAISLNPYNSRYFEQLGNIYQNLIGQMDNSESMALDAWDRQVKLDPNSPLPRYAVASLLTRLGRYREAVNYYQQVLSLKSDLAPAHYALADIYYSTGNNQPAADELKQTLQFTDPSTEDYIRVKKQLDEVNDLIKSSQNDSTSSSKPTTRGK